MTLRRRVIEHFCRLFLNETSTEIQMCRAIYKDLMRPIVSDSLPYGNIDGFIEGVGEELFRSRPANMAYIMVFLEFVSQIYNQIDHLKDEIEMSAANVIERTDFNPVISFSVLLEIMTSVCANIRSSVMKLFY